MFIAFDGHSFDKIKGAVSRKARMNVYRSVGQIAHGREEEQSKLYSKKKTVIIGIQTKFQSEAKLFELTCDPETGKNELNDFFRGNDNDKVLKDPIVLKEDSSKWWGKKQDKNINKMIGLYKFSLDCAEDPSKEFYIIEVLADRISIFDCGGFKLFTQMDLEIRDVVMNDSRYLYIL